MPEPRLSVRDLSVEYATPEGAVHAVDRVSFDVTGVRTWAWWASRDAARRDRPGLGGAGAPSSWPGWWVAEEALRPGT